MNWEVPFRRQHCNGSFVLEPLIWKKVTSGKAELEADTRHVAMVLRDLGLEKSPPVVALFDKRPSEDFLLLASAKHLNAEGTTLYKSVTMRVNYLSLGRPTCIRRKISGTSSEESHDEKLRGTQTCWALLARTTHRV